MLNGAWGGVTISISNSFGTTAFGLQIQFVVQINFNARGNLAPVTIKSHAPWEQVEDSGLNTLKAKTGNGNLNPVQQGFSV